MPGPSCGALVMNGQAYVYIMASTRNGTIYLGYSIYRNAHGNIVTDSSKVSRNATVANCWFGTKRTKVGKKHGSASCA